MPTLTLDGTTVNYTDTGSGEPVLLLHCSSSSGAQWRQLSDLLKGDYRALAIDLYGYGETDPWTGPPPPFRTEDEVALVAAVASAVGPPVHLVGHSYGGLVALRLALAEAVPLRSLVLIEPIAFWLLGLAGEDELLSEIRGIADGFNAAIDRGEPEAGVEPYVDYWNGPGAWRSLPDPVRRYVMDTAAKVYHEWGSAFDVSIPLSEMERLRVPTLILCGGITNRTTRRITELLVERIAGARSATIPGARHMSPISHPDAVNAEIRGHLESHRAP